MSLRGRALGAVARLRTHGVRLVYDDIASAGRRSRKLIDRDSDSELRRYNENVIVIINAKKATKFSRRFERSRKATQRAEYRTYCRGNREIRRFCRPHPSGVQRANAEDESAKLRDGGGPLVVLFEHEGLRALLTFWAQADRKTDGDGRSGRAERTSGLTRGAAPDPALPVESGQMLVSA
jgi:hypothetical protein